MYRLLATLLTTPVLLTACIEIRSETPVEVTPGTVPPEIRDARWPETPVSYCTVPGEDGFVDYETFVRLTQEAVAAWGVPTTYEGDCSEGITAGNGTNQIGWGDLGGAPNSVNEAGNTNIRYRSRLDGQPPDIIEADITIERQPTSGRDTEECLYTTLLHESGHLFGLPHLDQSTVMSTVITECRQELTPADRNAIEELY